MKVLVPLDGSALSEEVLRPIAKFAIQGNTVVLMTVVNSGESQTVWKQAPSGVGDRRGMTAATGRALSTTRRNTGTMSETPAQAEEAAVVAAADYMRAVVRTNFRKPVETEVVEGVERCKGNSRSRSARAGRPDGDGDPRAHGSVPGRCRERRRGGAAGRRVSRDAGAADRRGVAVAHRLGCQDSDSTP